MAKTMFVVTVNFKIKRENIDAFRSSMKSQADNSLNLESDCLRFDICYDPTDGSECFLYEIYRNEAAFKVHLESNHFKTFDQTVAPWIESKTVNTWFLAD